MNENKRTTNWTGIVEDYDDPLMNGRLRVRIFGFHNPNKTVLPTESLPWAMVGLPVNCSRTTAGPKIGDWVCGYFFDGAESAQLPIVTHVLPGIISVVVKQPAGAPEMPAGEIYEILKEPSGSPLGRGVVPNTAIDKSNRGLAHICDISYEVDQATGALKNFFSTVIAGIRYLINLVIGAANIDETGFIKKIVEDIRSVIRLIKYYNKILRDVKKAIDGFLSIVRRVRAMIDWVLSLPAKAAKFFKDCLMKLYKTISAGITNLFPDLGIEGDFAELASAVEEGVKALNETTSLVTSIAATPLKLGAVLLTPTTAAEAEAAGKELTTLIKDAGISPNPTENGQGA